MEKDQNQSDLERGDGPWKQWHGSYESSKKVLLICICDNCLKYKGQYYKDIWGHMLIVPSFEKFRIK